MRSLLPFVSVLLFAVACATPIQLPKDFLEIDGRGEFQAVTGDDARVWIREFETPERAPLSFWATAVEHDFVQQRGYDVVARGEVKNKHGRTGSWFECTANVRGERIGYLVAVWADGDEVQVVEFAARADVFAARVESMKAALRTVRW